MRGKRLVGAALAALVLASAALAVAQRGWRRRQAIERRADPRDGVPTWELDRDMPDDVFTFARLRYDGDWDTDYPAAELNLSFRLQQLTSLKVHPDGKVIDLTDPALNDYPFVYMIEPGRMRLTDAEVQALRRYLLGGGFMMVDDFWGEREWNNFYEHMKRVFPEREPVDLDISHPIFHAVFDLKAKPQMPSIHTWWQTGLTYERRDAAEVHYQAWFDDDKRLMVIACHNTDLGDGWEREGEDPAYFRTFAETMAYPMGINILFYAMTH